ncbi:hypothetical protein Dsin_022391 [Dipteronia sinensis]|uniref:Amino acid transporter transmembrane domain-containing protein n=1 Tax=Dipteronia sinensis TaxID=43782 RepID=A0AAE0A2R7_9ROSI|nr:hypothetical protein Dsin_022391 [Dipteronia sinensis]
MGVMTSGDAETPLLLHEEDELPVESSVNRTGNVWTAVAHIITGVVGSGVLSLAWSVAQLGWIAGHLAMLFLASITLTSSFLLCNCYRTPHPQHGPGRNRSYLEAVHMTLENGFVQGSLTGIRTSSAVEKMWLVSQALGDIAFAYPYSLILIEIQDTLKSPPSEYQTMKKASTISIIVTTFFYLLCGGFCYAAFAEDTPGNLRTGFGFYEPYWLIDFANACIVIHLVGGYQVFSQPLYGNVERWISEKYPHIGFINNEFYLKLPLIPAFRLNLLRLCFRTVYVVCTTAIAMIFPYFNQVIGVIGGINFWPLTIYFPVEKYFKQRNIEAWTTKWVMLRIFTFGCFLVTMFALVGSIEGLISAKMS